MLPGSTLLCLYSVLVQHFEKHKRGKKDCNAYAAKVVYLAACEEIREGAHVPLVVEDHRVVHCHAGVRPGVPHDPACTVAEEIGDHRRGRNISCEGMKIDLNAEIRLGVIRFLACRNTQSDQRFVCACGRVMRVCVVLV